MTEGERDPDPKGAVLWSEEEPPPPVRLLFVCTGNTCRSPMALGLARRRLQDWEWKHIEVKSAGVAALSGSPVSVGALRAAEGHGIDLSLHRSTQLDADLVRWADLILTMSPGHLFAVETLGGADKAALITEFAADLEAFAESSSAGVMDPIGGDDALYEETFDQLLLLVEKALRRLPPAESQ